MMLKRNFIMLMATLMLCLGLASTAMANEPAVISVSGEGVAEVAPDMATITLGVTTNARTAQLAQADNAAAANRIIAALGAQGIYSKDIKTSYTFSPVYDTKNYSKVTGYRADNTMTVTVNDISKVGDVIDSALANGANEVHSLSYGIKDMQSVHNAAIQAAVRDARSKADAVASALGVQIIGVKHVSVSGNYNRYERADISMMKLGAANMESTPVSPGTMDVRANVSIEYQIQ